MRTHSLYEAAIYPFSRDTLPFLANLSPRETGIQVEGLVALEGYGLRDRDASYADQREPLGMVVHGDLGDALGRCGALLVPSGNYDDDVREQILAGIDRAIALGKHVLCAVALRQEEKSRIAQQCEQQGVDFVYYEDRTILGQNERYQQPTRLYRPTAPVILVGEMVEGLNALDAALAIASHFTRAGYRVSSLLVPDTAKLFGLRSIGEIGLNTLPSPETGIDAINNYIKAVDQTERPDVIVVQLPGGMLPYNDIVTNAYGIYAFMMCQAVSADCFVLCRPYMDTIWEEAYIRPLFQYRFGLSIDCVHVSNAFIDPSNVTTFHRIEKTYLPLSQVDASILALEANKDCTLPYVNMLREAGRVRMCERIESILISYGNATSI